ncbi:MAG: hypothetical protein HC795_17870 [Coleofasciculaceae cyanobacterium RL_1_1]|nr:hypothetical protein [Coleofasciculaceae cyanobacterium RL_1_1]
MSCGVIATTSALAIADESESYSGQVKRVWEDGFLLETSERTITVDSYDVCGDNTGRHITSGDQITVTGEFEWGEFDAFSIQAEDETFLCD